MRLQEHRAGRFVFLSATIACALVAASVALVLARNIVVPAEAGAAPRTQAVQAPVAAARVRLEAVGTERDGITGRPHAEQTNVRAVGQDLSLHLGASTEADPSIGQVRFVDASGEDRLLLWGVRINVLSIAAGRTTMQIHWTRLRRGTPAPERDEARTITLGPGDFHILDYVEGQSDSDPCASLLLRVSAEPIVQSTERLGIDLWTVDEGDAAGPQAVHKRVEGFGPEPLDTAFLR